MAGRNTPRQLGTYQLECCSIASKRCRRFTGRYGRWKRTWRHAGYSSVGGALEDKTRQVATYNQAIHWEKRSVEINEPGWRYAAGLLVGWEIRHGRQQPTISWMVSRQATRQAQHYATLLLESCWLDGLLHQATRQLEINEPGWRHTGLLICKQRTSSWMASRWAA